MWDLAQGKQVVHLLLIFVPAMVNPIVCGYAIKLINDYSLFSHVEVVLDSYIFLNKLQELLLAGADPNAVDDEGETMLHRAVTK